MFIIPKFLSQECIEETLEIALRDFNWAATHYTPTRCTTQIFEYPLLKKSLDSIIGNYELFYENRIYFARYLETEKCLIHKDPTPYTMIIPIQSPLLGGNLVINNKKEQIAPLKTGDAVIFKGSDQHYVTPVMKGTRISLALWFKYLPDEFTSKI